MSIDFSDTTGVNSERVDSDERRRRAVERRDVERDHGRARRRQTRDQVVADLAAGAGNEKTGLRMSNCGLFLVPRRHQHVHRRVHTHEVAGSSPAAPTT